MATHINQFADEFRSVLEYHGARNLTDADLWQRYVEDRDHSAFETMVKRHGPMVLRACRRILRNEQDAEDAFQATFLVLIRRASSIQSPGAIASWLHGVALRTAMETRSARTRRRAIEGALIPQSQAPEDPWSELWPVLDEELERLSEPYRAAVILCDLEGKSRKEAAQQLGLAEGTVASRLARGRNILARRLARRGFAGALATVASASAPAAADACARQLYKTVASSSVSLVKGESCQSLLSPRVISITEGVLKSMFLTKLNTAKISLALLAFAVVAIGIVISNSQATEPAGDTNNLQPKSQTNSGDLGKLLQDLKQQNEQMQKTIDKMTENLERETPPGKNEPNAGNSSLASLFKHKVDFEIGFSEFAEGGNIEIREVWGTRPKIEVGGQYLVRGKYKMPKGQRGKLYFYATAGGDWGNARLATLDLQMTEVDKQEGEFTLVHGMSGEGWFHLILTERDKYSRMFANVYFGTGDNVHRRFGAALEKSGK